MEVAASCPSSYTMTRYIPHAASSYPTDSHLSALGSELDVLTNVTFSAGDLVYPLTTTQSTDSTPGRPVQRPSVRSSRAERQHPSFTVNGKNDMSSRIFKCTFCFEAFRTKFEWARHEKSLHLNMEEWACAPYGGMIISDLTGAVHCAYCNIINPTVQHIEQHHHRDCRGPSSDVRMFSRKDHLIQHLRHFHRLESLPAVDNWKLEGTQVSSRCGFCGTGLATWPRRADHLALHFRQGKTMDDWSGDHGFLPSIAARVKNSIPPYLLGYKSSSPGSFDTITRGGPNASLEQYQQDVFNQMHSDLEGTGLDHLSSTSSLNSTVGSRPSGSSTYSDFLTLHLARFARKQISLGCIPTDRMFQEEAKRLFLSWVQGHRPYVDDWAWP